MRKILATVVVTLFAVLVFGAISEAAPKTNVRHRPRHSSRVSTGAPAKKKATKAKKKARKAPKQKSKTAEKPKQ